MINTYTRILLALLLSSCGLMSYAQKPENLELYIYDINDPNRSYKTATQSIVIKPDQGFYVPAGELFHAEITEQIVPAAPNENRNYIVINTILKSGKLTATDLQNLTLQEVQQSITYFDGLGRPIQQVMTQGSPTKKDIVQPIDYDIFGREIFKYLPYTKENNGLFKTSAITGSDGTYTSSDQYSFYQGSSATTDGRATDTSPRAETYFENSPLNRVLEQGAAGQVWSILKSNGVSTGAGNTTKLNLRFNRQVSTTAFGASDDNIWLFTYIPTSSTADPTLFGNVSAAGFYPVNQLSVVETTDEHGARVIEYKDREGKVIVKKVQEIIDKPTTSVDETSFVSTYYIYDQFDLLRLVIQPEGVAQISTVSFTVTDAFINLWCFRYRYDKRNRLIEKRVPGAGAVYMVYNKRDELILTQDGKQRADKQWSYTKYDALGRVVQTGIYTNSTVEGQKAMQEQAYGIIPQHENRNTNWTGFSTHLGYTNIAFPTTDTQILAVNYYDDYNFDNNGSADASFNTSAASGMSAGITLASKTTGKPTAAKVRVLPSGNFLTSATFYDQDGRLVQTQSDNHIGGQEIVTSILDFTGRVLQSKLVHTTTLSDASTVTVVKNNTYDHAGRLLSLTQSTNGISDEKLSQVSYNELGQVKQKKLGLPATTASVLQTIDYGYTIRGWMKTINDANLSTRSADKDLFGMELLYNDGITPQFNGNISGQKWRSAIDNVARSYAYEYDAMNRLKKAFYTGGSGENYSTTGYDAANSTETGMRYDRNGNILSLGQYGLQSQTNSTDRQYGLIDKLKYSYTGNRLRSVADNGTVTTAAGPAVDFVDGASLTDEYLYDDNAYGKGNGNLVEDKNKQLTTISYNHLNLPTQIIFEGNMNKRIEYLYDAGGKKLRKTVYEPGKAASTTDYAGGFVYVDNALQFFAHEEGRTFSPQAANQASFVYEYNYKDHLGNLRVSFRQGSVSPHSVTMEKTNALREERAWANVSSTRDNYTSYSSQYYRTGSGSGGYAAKLNNSQVLGPWKQIPLNQGDQVSMSAYAYYPTANTGGDSDVLLSVYLGNAGANSGGAESRNAPNLVQAGLTFFPSPSSSSGSGIPKAYLKYMFFKKDGSFVTGGQKLIINEANISWESLFLSYLASEDGYLQVMVANESGAYVWFDDIAVTVTGSMIVQENHYSPFGLNLSGIEKQGQPDDKFQYNGKEKQSELGLNWNDYGARMYDPQLGRFHTQDRYAEKYLGFTPYQYGANNPIVNIDINGDSIWVTTTNRTETMGGKTYNYVNHTIHVQGKVIDLSDSPINVNEVAAGIQGRLNAASSSLTTLSDGTNETIVSYSFDANISVAKSMDDVSNSDHLIAIVDDVTLNGDSRYNGVGPFYSKISYVESNTFDQNQMITTGIHELGHNMGLTHRFDDSNNYMSYSNSRKNFDFGQYRSIVSETGKMNQGNNYSIIGKSSNNYLWHNSTINAPYDFNVQKGDKVPRILPTTGW